MLRVGVAALLVCGWLIAGTVEVSAQANEPPPNFTGLVPVDDADIAALGAALDAFPGDVGSCNRTNCPEYSCSAMSALFGAVSSAEDAAILDTSALKSAVTDYRKLLDQYENDYERLVEDKTNREYAHALSSASLTVGRLLLDVASLAGGVASFPDVARKIDGASNAADFANLIRLVDIQVEEATGLLSTTDDAVTALRGKSGLSTEFTRTLTIKSALSDTASALIAFQANLKNVRAVAEAGNKVATAKAIRDAFGGTMVSGVAQLIAKLAIPFAEKQLAELKDAIADDALNQAAANNAFSDNYKPFMRLIEREIATAKLRDKLATIRDRITPCAARCSEWTGVPAAPNVAGMSYGAILKTYGTFSDTVSPAVGKLRFSVGILPQITATPTVVQPSGPAGGRYSLPQCPATEGAYLRLIYPGFTFTELGPASTGENQSVSFTAPVDPDDYELQILDAHGITIARGPLTVSRTTLDPCLIGKWLATKVALGSENFPADSGGGPGFVVTIAADGLETVDYSGMKPFMFLNGKGERTDKIAFGGVGKGRITTHDGLAVLVEGIEGTADMETDLEVVGHHTSVPYGKKMGPGGLGTTEGSPYTCVADELKFTGSVRKDGKPNLPVTLARQAK